MDEDPDELHIKTGIGLYVKGTSPRGIRAAQERARGHARLGACSLLIRWLLVLLTVVLSIVYPEQAKDMWSAAGSEIVALIR